MPPETLMSIMEMEIDDEDFAGPDAARLLLFSLLVPRCCTSTMA